MAYDHMGLISFAIVLVSAFIHGATAADNYTVLDGQGWRVTSQDAYRNWAANKDFEVGDVLIFNFPTNQHDVAEVTKEAFDSCNGTNTISLELNGPARIRLNTSGDHYFICTFNGHCNAGQKLAIRVRSDDDAVSPSRSPTSPPRSTPGSRDTPDNYTVLDSQGWGIPRSPDAYRNWAANKDFEVGDMLIFNFPTQQHDVAEVTKAAFDSCSGTNPISIQRNGPATIRLDSTGNHYFICTFPGHCNAGQKLAITVGSNDDAVSPSGSPSPPRRTPGSALPPQTPGVDGANPSGPSGPTPRNSAQSIAVSSLSIAALMSLAIAFLH
ncbi:hypothetical protein Scep_008381 [Stephania cephalantha]|uniref:Phytocyanin domain-containing protein n=1 Tax=Stephania cephalantha TaxID=152367 RepID=A0AAP0KDM9_9MAGN